MIRNGDTPKGLLEIVAKSLPGMFEPGNLAVVMARAGVGKTSFLVQLALGEMVSGRDVAHVAVGQSVDEVRRRYRGLFREMAEVCGMENNENIRFGLSRHRAIQTFATGEFSQIKLKKAVENFKEHLELKPKVVLLDGFDWETADKETLNRLKDVSRDIGAPIWMTAKTSRDQSGLHPQEIPPPCDKFVDLLDVVIFLDPVESLIKPRLLKAFGKEPLAEMKFKLSPNTMRPTLGDELSGGGKLIPQNCALYSGAAEGAETIFGMCAEKWGLTEWNYSYPGRKVARSRGIVLLDPKELKMGDVSWLYLTNRMNRQYKQTDEFKKLLQTIWHQVSPAAEVFAVGVILPDNTVKGGTGWAVELAKHLKKPLHAFDQSVNKWFFWKESDDRWLEVDPPQISYTRFAGAGTRDLTDSGKEAIESLFERTFGQS